MAAVTGRSIVLSVHLTEKVQTQMLQ